MRALAASSVGEASGFRFAFEYSPLGCVSGKYSSAQVCMPSVYHTQMYFIQTSTDRQYTRTGDECYRHWIVEKGALRPFKVVIERE